MKLTKWVSWKDIDNYIDPTAERLKLWNPDKFVISPKATIKKYAQQHSISEEAAYNELKAENDAKPDYVDQKKADEWKNIYDECEQTLFDYCVDNHIFISDSEHQAEDFNGVPVLDGKYIITFTLRSWSGLMADVWNKILNRSGEDEYNYLTFYCNGPTEEIEEYLKKF